MTTFSIRCTDENAAQLAHAWLISEGVEVQGTDGCDVLVPTSYPPFVFDVAETLVSNGFAHDHDAAESTRQFLNRLEQETQP